LQEITSVQPLSAGIFLENRGGRTLKTAKAWKTLEIVGSGNAITEPQVYKAVEEHVKIQKRPAKPSIEIIPTKKTRSKVKINLPKSPVPDPSGLHGWGSVRFWRKCDNSDIPESDKCIVCHHLCPQYRNKCPYLTIVKCGGGGSCDKCDGLVHLAICSEVRVLRLGDTFLCPNCKKYIILDFKMWIVNR
jgi:hypothetical protein